MMAEPAPSLERGPEPSHDRRPVLELRNVSTHYGLVSVLRDVDMEIYPGEMVCLLGGNASGKTTTLRTILGYVTPSAGEVVLEGEVVSGMPTVEVVRRGDAASLTAKVPQCPPQPSCRYFWFQAIGRVARKLAVLPVTGLVT